MENLHILEENYLKAKIAYYEGIPFLTDPEFDSLEQYLKDKGSKIIEQVGSKRKDFNFPHPTKMLSLAKIQTEKVNQTTDYKFEDFTKWYKKCASKVGNYTLKVSPKFDGNAINIIYRGKNLTTVLTRGDGFFGKDITKRLQNKFPAVINVSNLEIKPTDTLEIRCEVVIDINLFNSKYADKFANARNYVAGVIGKDDVDIEKVNELDVIPLIYILNGKHIESNYFSKNDVFHNNHSILVEADNYVQTIQFYEQMREKFPYQLDGVVFIFPESCRETLGENSHDPEYSVAIKFIPVEVVTEVEDIEWNVSKRGEIVPVVLLKPVFLDGSTVKRASGYNARYIISKGLAPGAVISIHKSGDIIPEIQTVVVPKFDNLVLPTHCPVCNSESEYNTVHLMCTNENCVGKVAKQLSSAIKVLGLKGIGEKTIEPFAKDFVNMYELILWARIEGETISGNIDQYGIKYGSKSHKIFLDAFKNIKSLTYSQVIQMLGYENVGDKLSIQLAREHADLDFDYSNLEKALVEKLRNKDVSDYIKYIVNSLENLGIVIDKPKKVEKMENSIYVCLTGSPKSAGYKTKEEFLAKFSSLIEVSITDKKCQNLITDSLSSSSSKMKEANKRGIEIKTYNDFTL